MTFRIYTRRKEGTSAVVLCLCFCVLLVHVQADLVDHHWPKCLTNKQVDTTQRRHLELSIEMSSRITHQLATHIFRILLEEELGYAQVKIVYYDDYNAENITERLYCYEGKTEEGKIDSVSQIDPTTKINLEVPIPPDYIISSLDKGCFKEFGVILPPGHFGLFIPYVLVEDLKKYDNNWQSNSFDIHWTNFKNPNFAKTLDLKSELDLMTYINRNTRNINSQRYFCEDERCKDGWFIPERCKEKSCAVVLASDFNNSNVLIDHINQMGVYMKVVWVGPNLDDVSKKLTDSLRKKSKTFLIFSWTPSNTILNPKEFVGVSMGSCEVDENGTPTGIGCFYGLRRSVKFASEAVKEESSETYDLLKSMTFMENDDFGFLMELYKNGTAIGKTIPDIACEWVQKRNTSWSLWSSSSSQGKKKKLYIGGIFPITGSTYTGRGIVKGAKMAKEAINRNGSILPDYDVEVLVANGQCRADKVMQAFIDYLTQKLYNSLIGVLGPACSDTVEPLAGLSKYYKTITISYSAEGAVFSDRDKYPYFLRTIGENTHYKYVYLELLKKLKWRRVAALTEDGQKYTEYISHMQNMLEAHHITFISNAKFPRVRERDPMTKYLEDLKQKQARIIIADVFDEIARNVMCEAHRLKMTAKQGYVWFLPTWLNTTWYDTNYFNQHLNETVNCTTANMIEAINGYFTITHAFFEDDDAIMQENITVRQWKENYRMLDSKLNETSNYAGYAYDAVWTFALGVDKLIKEDPDAMYMLHSANVTKKLTEIMKSSDFNGVSGRINFRGGTTRFSVINIMQWHDNQSRIIGKFYPNISDHEPEIIGGTLDLNESAIVWLSGGRPDDGTLPLDECALNGLAKFLNVKCDMAIIILNLFIIVLLLAILGTVILVIKRRYDKKVMNTEQYMKSLGLEHLLATTDYTGLDKWEIARENVVLNRKLGEGAFGTVYGGEAKLPDSGWTPVAVKTLKIGSTPDEKLDFLSEAEVMKRFDHKNIVKLLGVCTKVEPVYTIMEFMLYGDLKTYLLARRHLVNGSNVDETEEVSSKKLTQMAIDVARGLSYLAELKYVHRDVASRNCLLNGQRVVKLGDFGMTRPTCDNDYYKFNRKGMLPVRWMAPESLALGVFTPSSDVWSFGVLLYEIITFGSFPFQGLSNFQVLEYVKAGNTITIPQGVKTATEFLLKTCWSSDPKLRPTASELVEYLANNSRIISPCLDLPLSSVQMEDNQLEMQLPDQFRKCSSSLSFKNLPLANGISPMSVHSPTRRQQSIPCDSGVSIPLENCCPKEPLLPPRSDSISGCSKYVTLQHSDSGCEQEQDNYFPNSIINGHAVSKV